MAIPKANNDHFSMKNMKFFRKEFIHLNSRETHGLNPIMTTFCEKHKILQTQVIHPTSCKICGLDQNWVNFVYF